MLYEWSERVNSASRGLERGSSASRGTGEFRGDIFVVCDEREAEWGWVGEGEGG